MSEAEMGQDYRFGDHENGFELFFGLLGTADYQFENPVDNPLYRFKAYDYIDNYLYPSKVKVIECPQEKKQHYFSKY